MSSGPQQLPSAPFPILTSVAELRQWRAQQLQEGNTIGFVPTMGALHDGHISLVNESLSRTDSTIVSIFVNPAQFAPTEDLATYPRTLEADLERLKAAQYHPSSGTTPRNVTALFLPPVSALYPSGITTQVSEQRGTFVEVKGLQEVMEGVSRPGFFRGVATVVLKLFNLVQPTRAFFGQKDIQQCLLLRRMLLDLHVPHPLPSDLVIFPTHRDATTHLALSSRNAYLSVAERPWATVLIDALKACEHEWTRQRNENPDGKVLVGSVLNEAKKHFAQVQERASTSADGAGVTISPIYVELNDPLELTRLGYDHAVPCGHGAILSGAVMLGRTRLIDNLVLEFDLN
ncbi:BQ5605_C011g06426 [Microbotryum silenes-dioicae]|uniref:Pantoate--beta-alanine ligase n=1 Tax=Microbotryum silenes-dioicae TaxID=796604 RepID=A0A2X0LP06_9BASI|nr:BQ5605_C011g06426 [Microbotryum silenes-dioicae]